MNYSIYEMHKLEDICNVSSSKRIYASEYVDEGIAFWRSKEVIQKANNEEISDVLYITKERFEEIKMKFGAPKKGDILLASIGANMGTSYYVNIDTDFYFKDGNVTWFSNFSENINNMYLYFCLNWNIVKTNMLNRAIGSAQKALTIESLKKLEIPLPSIEEQKAIAKVLSDLDEKIETNNKINKTLEEMAQAIFKQWFVDFEFPNEEGKPYRSSGGEMVESELGKIPKKWKVVKLHEIGNLTMGLSPKSESYNTTGEGIPLLNGAADFSGGLIKANKYTTQKTRLCKVKDLVFCIRATIGNITFADREYCLGRGVASIGSKEDLYIGLIYMNLLKSIEKLKAQATGSVILGLSKPDINDMKLILPTNDILNKYSNLFNSVFDKKHALELENEKLINIRDTLLPKLMSGEIRVQLD